jgi:SAM-dependent methyltransferase
MSASLTPAERFLVDFHDRRPGITAQVFHALPASKGGVLAASSYHHLAALVPAGDSPCTVLDVACGDGHLLALVAASRPASNSLVGIDISGGELHAARQRLGPRATLVQARAQALPLPDASVDGVLCHLALMLMDELDTVLAQVRRVLRPGGFFGFVVGARPPPSAALSLFLAQLAAIRQRLGSGVPELGDRRLARPERIEQLLAGPFGGVVIDELSVTRRCTPAELWAWFDGMYDLDGLDAAVLADMRTAYIDALTPLCDADGRVAYTDALRLVRATAV